MVGGVRDRAPHVPKDPHSLSRLRRFTAAIERKCKQQGGGRRAALTIIVKYSALGMLIPASASPAMACQAKRRAALTSGA